MFRKLEGLKARTTCKIFLHCRPLPPPICLSYCLGELCGLSQAICVSNCGMNVFWCIYRSFLATGYWFGLYRENTGEPEKWYDGNPSTYRNWAPGEPAPLRKRIIYTTNGFEGVGASKRYYSCKKPAGNVFRQLIKYTGCFSPNKLV